MKVARCLNNIGLISKQYKKETGHEFDLNKLIQWLGNRLVIEIDDSLLNE